MTRQIGVKSFSAFRRKPALQVHYNLHWKALHPAFKYKLPWGCRQKNFQGRSNRKTNTEKQGQYISLHFTSGDLGGALGMHPGLTSRNRYIKNPT